MGKITWITINGPLRAKEADKEPSLHAMFNFLGGFPEHVSVLHDGKEASMYVHGNGVALGLPINETATEIYRAARGVENPYCIHGKAILVEGMEQEQEQAQEQQR